MRVLCRVDAGPKRGLGHLQRCLALADALKARALQAVFVGPRLGDVRDIIEERGHGFGPVDLAESEAGTGRDASAVIRAAREYQCRMVVVDSYDIDNGYLQALRTAGLFVVVLDDFALHPFAAHIVVNGGAAARALSYSSSSGDTRFLLGPQYALLSSVFEKTDKRIISPSVHRILLSVGGSDPHRALPRMLQILDAVQMPFVIAVVVGPFVDGLGGLAGEQYRHEVDFVRAPQDLQDLMLNADLAISAGGQTLYELAATGTPTVAVEVFDNQAVNIRHLAAKGVVREGGCITDGDFDQRLPATVTEVIGDKAARAQLSSAGQLLIDGCGAGRVADEIIRSL